MRTIDIGISKIDKIYHIADVHVRNVKRHKEYEQVFKRLYKYIKKTKTPNSVIYVAGDIVHAKTDMSPELVQTVSDFFKNLADLAPTIIITGNHDCNLNNASRLDALSPIVKALNHNCIHYLKDTGIYSISNVHFNVMSVFDPPAKFIKASDFDGEYKIALHHGAVNSAQTDLGITLSNTHVTSELFKGHDLVLLGDIHKPQFLNAEKTIAYAGSLIQQNFGEGLLHGIMVWDLDTRSCEFVEIENDYGYLTLEIESGKIITAVTKAPKRIRLRLKVKDTDSASLKQIISELRSQYSIQDVTIQKVNPLNAVSNGKKISFGNVRDVEWQNKVITEYLDNEYALDDDMLDVVRHINRTVHSKLTQSDITRNKLWIPKTFEFSNMFSYGDDNFIDFGNLSGTYGLFAPNASGKSTLLDALAFCCFDKCSRTSKAVHVLNNKKTQFRSKFCFEMDGIDYYIERNGRKNNGGHVKVDVDFYHYDDSGAKVSLNGEQRDNTNKSIRTYLGDYEDFVLTALSLQGNNTGFIDMSQKDRKDLLSQFLDINVFEQQYQIASDDSRDTSALIREYKRTDYSTDLATAEQTILVVSKAYKTRTDEKETLEKLRDDINEQVIELTKELRTIPDNISDPKIHETKIAQLTDAKKVCQQQLDVAQQRMNEADDTYFNLKLRIDDVKIDALKRTAEEHRQYLKTLSDLKTEIHKKQHELDHAEKMVSKLEEHKWDPNCEYCMANPWLHDTKLAADQLPDLRREMEAYEFQLSQLLLAIDNTDVQKSIDEYHRLVSELNTASAIRSQSSDTFNGYFTKLQSTIDAYQQEVLLMARATECIADIEFNKQRTEEINELRDEINSMTQEIKTIDSEIIQLSAKLSVAEKTKQTAQNSIQRLRDLEIQNKGYEYYLQSVKRDGVPYQLIERALPQIEAEINNILAQIVDFTVILNTDGKNIHGYIVYDDENYWPLELTSGMEKFIASLAIRTSLISVTSLPRPNFLAIDEGFGVLDSDNMNSMYMLFDYLKSQFGFIMCISHIDAMRDVVDKLIEIKKDSGYSKINYS
jgi:DNA repair exonuclease SbcCD ATPase subunit/predicted MPP superfamily phosphohydrolase